MTLVSAKYYEDNAQFDNHIVNKSKNKIISEARRRKETRYIANYDEDGDIFTFSVSDKNFGFCINPLFPI